jgi:hypothetical protein
MEQRLAPAVTTKFNMGVLSVMMDAAGDTANIAVVNNNIVVTDGNNNTISTTADNTVTGITITGNNSANQTAALNSDFIFAGLSGLSVDKVTATTLKGSITTTTDQTYNDAVSLLSNSTLTSTGGKLTFGSTVAAGTDSLSLMADSIAFDGANFVSGTGKIELAPAAAGDSIGVDGGAGKLQLDATTLGALKSGFSQIVLGRDDGSGAVDVHAVTFSDPVLIESPGGSIAVNGQITGGANASVTLTGSGHTTTLNADIVTAGTAITINDNVLLGTPANITLDTTNGGGTPAGAAITITGTVDDDMAMTSSLTLQAGTAGDIGLNQSVGATAAPISLIVNSGHNVTFGGTIHTSSDVTQTTGTGTTTFNGTSGTGIGGALSITADAISLKTTTLTTVGAVQLTAAGDVTLNSALNAGASTVSILANQGGTGTKGFVQNAGGDITTTNATANAVNISVASGVTGAALQNITAGPGGTITVNANNGSITQAAGTLNAGTGTVTLQTGGLTSGIGTLAANINTSAANINATAGSGGAFITNANAGSFTVTATGTGNIQLISTMGTLTIAGKTATPNGDITLCSKAGAISAGATVAAGGTVRMAASTGVSQTASGEIDAQNLAVQAGGDVTLDQKANQITTTFAAANTGTGNVVRFLDGPAFSMGTVAGVAGTCVATDTVGVTTTNGDITLVTNGNALSIKGVVNAGMGTVRLGSGGGISQTAAITGANLGVSAAGDVALDQATNQVSGAFAAGDTGAGNVVRFLSGLSFSTGTVSGVAGTAFATGVTGVVTSNGDITLCTQGTNLTLNTAVNSGGNVVRLGSAGGVSQVSAGIITGTALAVQAAGAVQFDQATNQVNGSFAANDTTANAAVAFLDGAALSTGMIAGVAGTCFTATTTGVTSNNGDITLSSQTGALAINAAVNAGTGTARLAATGGGVSQTAAITAANLGVRAAGDIALDSVANQVSGSFAASDSGANNVVRFQDNVGFNSGTVTGTGTPGFTTTTTGVASTNGDIALCNNAGNMALDAVVNAGTGTVRLNSAGGISETAVITGANLGVRASGDVTLDQAVNSVSGIVAASNAAANKVIRFQDGLAFSTGTVLGVAGTCFTTDTTGVVSNNGDVTLCNKAGTLALTATVNAGTGTVRLNSGGGITQGTAITAANLGIQAAGDVVLDLLTNNIAANFAASNSGSGNVVRFLDANSTGFSVGQVGAANCFAGATGVVTAGGDVTLGDTAALAMLNINNVINAGSGTVRLALGNAITQANAASASITAGDLGITAGGNVTLDGATTQNKVTGKVAVSNAGSGDFFHFLDTSATGFTVGSVSALTFFTATTGIQTAGNGDVALTDKAGTANLTISNVVNAGSGAIRLALGGAISQDNAAAASITAGDLGITAGGNVTLDGASTTNVVTGNFAASDTNPGAFVHFLDTSSAGFTVGAVAALSDFGGATGVTTTGAGDVALCDTQTNANLSINAVITAGPVRLAFGHAVTQMKLASAAITATDLGIQAGDNITLDGASSNNQVTGNFAATTTGAGKFIHFGDAAATGFTVGTVSALSCFGGATGVTTASGDIALSALPGSAVISVNNVITAGSGSAARLSAGSDITQANLAAASITSGDLGIVSGGNVTLDGTSTANVVTGNFAANDGAAGKFVHFADTFGGGFTVGSVTALSLFGGATGVTTAGAGDIILTDAVSGANLRISNVITSGASDVRLGFGGAVMQDNSVGASITAVNLGVSANGDVTLAGPLTNNTALVFAAQNQGAGNVVDFFDRAALTIGPVGAAGRFQSVGGVLTNNGQIVLDTTSNFSVTDEGAGVDVIRSGSMTTNITAASGATTGKFTVDIEGQIDTTAGATITGAQGAGVTNAFFVRPGSSNNTGIEAIGNQASPPNQCRDTLQLTQLLEALGNPNTATIALAHNNPANLCDGTFTFNNNALRILDYKGFNLGGLSIRVTSALTSNNPANPFTINVQLFTPASQTSQQLFSINGVVPVSPTAVNVFLLSPVFANPSSLLGPPSVAVANVQGKGNTDIIFANGAGAPAVVTVVDGQLLATTQDFGQAIISRFFAFDPTYQGGLNVAAGALDNSGRASIVVSEDVAATSSEVRIFSPSILPGPSSANNPKQLIGFTSFNPYPSGFQGGVRLAVGDVKGTNPIIVTAPGPGAALPVEVFDAHTLQETQSFFPYGTGFSDGVFVATANLQANVLTNDILTGPGSGNPLLEIFNGPVYANTPNTSFLAFRSGTGTFPGNNNFVGAFNANTQIFGVSGVAFADISNGGTIRDILVGSGAGQGAVESTITLQQSDLYQTVSLPVMRTMFSSTPSPRGVNLASSQSTGTVISGALPFSDNFTTSNGGQIDNQWTVQLGAVAAGAGQAIGTGAFNLATVNGISQADVKAQASVNNLTAGQSIGIVTRHVGPGYHNFYLGQLRNTGSGLQGAIFVNLSGTFYLLNIGKTVPVPIVPETLEFETVGSSLKLIYNGQLIASAFDTTLTAGSVGIRLSQGVAASNFTSDNVTATSPTLPFSDNFMAPSDGSQLSRNWSDQLGNVTINSSNQAVGTGDTNLSTLNGISQADVKVSANNVSVGAGQTIGLVARYGGPLYSNFYLGQLRDTGSGLQAAIFKNIGGTFTTVAIGAIIPNAPGTLEFEAVGNSLKLIYGGKLVAHGFDSSFTTGSVGMRLSSGAAVTSFSADAATATNGALPFSDKFTSSSDGSQLSRNWSDQLGNISINGSNQAVGTDDFNLSTVNGINAADVTVQGDVNLVLGSGQTVGLVARYGGPGYSNFYLAQLRDTGSGFQAAIFKNIGGTFTLISLGMVSSTGTGTLKFKLHGTSLELDLGSTILATGVDSSLTSGSVGMRLSTNATLANFMAG